MPTPAAAAAAARGSSLGPAAAGSISAQASHLPPQQHAVGSQQLVAAVKDLLSAAGLPLDLEQAELLQHVAALKGSLAEARHQLDTTQAEASSQAAEVEQVKTSWQCKVRRLGSQGAADGRTLGGVSLAPHSPDLLALCTSRCKRPLLRHPLLIPQVCFANDVDCCFSACGHLFCASCAASLAGRCAACRKQGNVIRVFK